MLLLKLGSEQQAPNAHLKNIAPRLSFLPDKVYSFWFAVLLFFVLPGVAGGVKSYFWLCLIASIIDGEAPIPIREVRALPTSSIGQMSILLKSRLFPYVLLLLSVVLSMTVGRGTVWHAVVATILPIGGTGIAVYVMRLLLPGVALRVMQTVARIIGYAFAVFALYFVHPESSLIASAYGLILGTLAGATLFVMLRHRNLGTILRTTSARAESIA
ncbi:MAG: hypothetical protein IT366_21085 [Candidatus Hydrogenedentes bacterium]|nr:hypothetical protein [Candidatus Hydrogenedentota bacterium]